MQARPDKASVLLQGISASSRHQCPFKASELPQGISAPSRHQCPFKASVPLQGISAPSRHQCSHRASEQNRCMAQGPCSNLELRAEVAAVLTLL